MHLTVVYITSRLDCRIEWFFDSLRYQIGPDDDIDIVVVDMHWHKRPDKFTGPRTIHVSPKPCVWQGQHRLTKHEYFAASNARNTGLCLAKDGWIVYVDDLSVLLPTWLQSVREAMHFNYVCFGAFRKVKKLDVVKGLIYGFEPHPAGLDSRWGIGSDFAAVDCPPNWLFGCSVLVPVQGLLDINGWPEACDSTGLGGEDCVTGLTLHNAGYKCKYDRRMLTYESEELHFKEQGPLRNDKGISPRDKSHAMVNMFSAIKRFDNYFPEGGIAALRNQVLGGEAFPIQKIPEHDWYDGQPLSEL